MKKNATVTFLNFHVNAFFHAHCWNTKRFFVLLSLIAALLVANGCVTTHDDTKEYETDYTGGNNNNTTPTTATATDSETASQTVGATDTAVEQPEEATDVLMSACVGNSDAGVDGGEVETVTPVPLRETGVRVGVAISAGRLANTTYSNLAASEFNYVTAENEMKWENLEREPNKFTFTSADRIVKFAADNNMKVKGHTLVWYSQLPSWVEALQGADAVREAMTRHIETSMAHYRDEFPGVVVAWDVVNEGIDDGTNDHRDTVFYRELGEGYIAEAFEIARQVDPSVQLLYNDYSIDGLNDKSDATYEMIKRLLEAGVPIDGIGFQMHTAAGPWPTREEVEANLKRFADLGLKVNISEMDVTVCRGRGTKEERYQNQRTRYNEIVGTCIKNNMCDGVTFWGVGDIDSWLYSHSPCEDSELKPWPLLFDEKYERKPAWWGVFDALTGCFEW